MIVKSGDDLYTVLKNRGLCDEDIKLAVAMIERLKKRGG